MTTLRMTAATLLAVATVGAGGAAAAEEFTVGVQIPLTGAMARSGTGMAEGIQTAAELFNKANAKHRIKLVTVDDESNPAKAVAAVDPGRLHDLYFAREGAPLAT